MNSKVRVQGKSAAPAPIREMVVQAYTIAVAFMAGLGGLAAIGAVALALFYLGRPRKVRRSVMVFDAPQASPVALRDPDTLVRPVRETPFASHPPAAPRLRLDLALMSPRAPSRLKVPVDLARGRILELSLPLWVSTVGGGDLKDLKIRIVLPNEITYGASLDRLTRDPPAELAGAQASYVSTEHFTTIDILTPLLAGGTEAIIPVPVSIKHAAVGRYPILASASAQDLETIERRYEIELLDASAPASAELTSAGEWVCRPDEAARVRDPDLPLDRIVSTNFRISEDGNEPAEAAPLKL